MGAPIGCFWHATSSVSANALNARPSGHNGRPVARTRAVVFATAINTDSSSSARRDFGYVGTCRNMGWDALQTQCQPSSDVAEWLIARDVHGVEVFHGNGRLCPRLCTSPRGARISVQLWSRIDCPRLRRNHILAVKQSVKLRNSDFSWKVATNGSVTFTFVLHDSVASRVW
jgi:hypothetical protein